MSTQETEAEEETPEEVEKARDKEEEIEETEEEDEEAEEEERPAPEREEEEEVVEERVYTVPLGRAWIAPRNKRSPRAIRLLRSFVERHMKVNEDSVKISNEVSEKVWSRGIQKPPRKIRIRATKDTEGVVTVHLAEGS